MSKPHKPNPTQGWHLEYDVKNQCGRCSGTVREMRMVACMSSLPGFPAAHNCPAFTLKEDDE